jgi:hypothetical protein
MDINGLTPLDAMIRVSELKKLIVTERSDA